jgi:anaerobic selenocysteine-containing dehydrogenase
MVNHQRRPGIGPLMGWRGDGDQTGRGAPNPQQIEKYIENGGFFTAHVPDEARFFKPWNAAYQDWAVQMGFYDSPQPYVFQLYLEPLRKFQLAAEGHGERQPPEHLRERIRTCLDPLPLWYPPFEGEAVEGFPLHAITQRPAAMYHAWGSQNAWLRQIHGENPLYVPEAVAEAAGLQDGDWAWVTSHHGRIKVPVRRMAAVNPHTLWTWNAIGKREGAWALDRDAPEAKRGFLLNHLINELLPPKGDGHRWSNSDPVTGQAAWYDLRVRIEKAEGGAASEPRTGAQTSPVGTAPQELVFAGGKT